MVISQPAVVCLDVTVSHTAERAAAAGERLRRLLALRARPRPATQPLTGSVALPELPDYRSRPVTLRPDA